MRQLRKRQFVELIAPSFGQDFDLDERGEGGGSPFSVSLGPVVPERVVAFLLVSSTRSRSSGHTFLGLMLAR